MAVVPICYTMSYKDQCILNSKDNRQNERDFIGSIIPIQDDCRCLSSNSHGIPISQKLNTRKGMTVSQGATTRVSTSLQTTTELYLQTVLHSAVCYYRSSSNHAPQRDKRLTSCHAYNSTSNEKQLQRLDTYFAKLQSDTGKPSLASNHEEEDSIAQSGHSKAIRVLGTLDDYLDKVNKDSNPRDCLPSSSDDETTDAALHSAMEVSGRGQWKKLKSYMKLQNKNPEDGFKHSYDEASHLYLISILVSINIAVFLFEIASPVRNSDLELFSLPLAYGAKINHLILLGEWWRLVTPMFLHSGVLHIALSCWSVLTFGPRVCRLYGPFTFFLIYILGGISGNLTSFLHTPEPTVGGTGPVFAVIGAWLIYQIQNKDAMTKEDSENMLRKAITVTAISFILSNFGPIDDWAHVGAAFTGIAYGFLTCPILQMDDRSSKSGQEEGITLVRQYADPCKSLIVFSLFILVFSSLLFILEPPLDSLAVNSFF
ncbi:Rhomboid protease [Bertholletia excelsa]